MQRLCEQIELERWKELAYRVQEIRDWNDTEENFRQNLTKLKKMLEGLGIYQYGLAKFPKNEDEIGTASLLQAIYNNRRSNRYKSAHFFEIISTLDEIGIETLEFRPADLYGFVNNVEVKNDSLGNVTFVSKCFTDSKFKIRTNLEDASQSLYSMNFLEEGNFLLNFDVCKVDDNEPYIDDAEATLYNFEMEPSDFPDREEIISLQLPTLQVVGKQNFEWGTMPSKVTQSYKTFKREESSYYKELKKTKNGIYYYTK